jgi:hypothetical protein
MSIRLHTTKDKKGQTLQEEIKIIDSRYASIDDSARTRITIAVSSTLFRRVEPRVVALATDNDCELRLIWSLRSIEFLESLLDCGKLFPDNDSKLTLLTTNISSSLVL